ncbi:DUF6574 domain-containing protein [Streptococcus suis]
MKKIDWIEYFEAINGRSPEAHEIEAALAAGEFEEDVLQNVPTEEVVQEEKVDAESTVEPVSAPEDIPAQQPVQEPAQAFAQQTNAQAQQAQPQPTVQQVNPQALQQAPAAPSAFGLFFKQFREWIVSAWKKPTSIASHTHKYNGLTSLLLIAFFAALTIYFPMVKAANSVNSFTNSLTSELGSLFEGANGYDSYGSSAPAVSVGLDILFKTFIGISLIIFSIVLAGFVVKRFIYKEQQYTFAYTLEYYGRLFAVNVLLYAIAALSAVLGIFSLVGIATSLALFAVGSASVYALANFTNSSQMDSLYRYFIAILVNGLIIFVSGIIAASIVGQMFWSSLF